MAILNLSSDLNSLSDLSKSFHSSAAKLDEVRRPQSLFEIALRTLSLDLACYADRDRDDCSLLNIMRTMARLIVKHLEQYIATTASNSIIAWNSGHFNSDQQDSFNRLKIYHHI